MLYMSEHVMIYLDITLKSIYETAMLFHIKVNASFKGTTVVFKLRQKTEERYLTNNRVVFNWKHLLIIVFIECKDFLNSPTQIIQSSPYYFPNPLNLVYSLILVYPLNLHRCDEI